MARSKRKSVRKKHLHAMKLKRRKKRAAVEQPEQPAAAPAAPSE